MCLKRQVEWRRESGMLITLHTYILWHRSNADYVEAICASKLTLDLFSGGGVYTCSTPLGSRAY